LSRRRPGPGGCALPRVAEPPRRCPGGDGGRQVTGMSGGWGETPGSSQKISGMRVTLPSRLARSGRLNSRGCLPVGAGRTRGGSRRVVERRSGPGPASPPPRGADFLERRRWRHLPPVSVGRGPPRSAPISQGIQDDLRRLRWAVSTGFPRERGQGKVGYLQLGLGPVHRRDARSALPAGKSTKRVFVHHREWGPTAAGERSARARGTLRAARWAAPNGRAITRWASPGPFRREPNRVILPARVGLPPSTWKVHAHCGTLPVTDSGRRFRNCR